MAVDDLTMALIREVAELERKVEHTRQWHGARWERLSQWAREELPEPLKTRFFNIVANGTADVMEPPTASQEYHRMKHRAEKAEAELVRLRAAGVSAAPAPLMVPLSDDGKSVFIDGFGEVPLAHPVGVAIPQPGQENKA